LRSWICPKATGETADSSDESDDWGFALHGNSRSRLSGVFVVRRAGTNAVGTEGIR
jgi:hypothetical protein